MLKQLWALIRPYFTVARVTVLVTSLVTPLAAVAAGWIAIKAAQWGYNPDPAEITAAFITGVVSVIAVVVPLVRKFLDSKTATDTALIAANLTHLVGAKSISSQIKANGGIAPPPPDEQPDSRDGAGRIPPPR